MNNADNSLTVYLQGYEDAQYYSNFSYICFEIYNATIVEAEDCLFRNKTD